jgi:hypothetical protein
MCANTSIAMGSSEPTQRKFDDAAPTSSESESCDDELNIVEMASLVEDNNNNNDDGTVVKSLDSPSNGGPPNQSCIDWLILNTKKQSKVLSACSLYSFCSVSMVLVNKSLASRYETTFSNHDVGCRDVC